MKYYVIYPVPRDNESSTYLLDIAIFHDKNKANKFAEKCDGALVQTQEQFTKMIMLIESK